MHLTSKKDTLKLHCHKSLLLIKSCNLRVFVVQYFRSSGEWNDSPLQCSCLGNPMDKEPGRLQSMGSPRVRLDWAAEHPFWIQTWFLALTADPGLWDKSPKLILFLIPHYTLREIIPCLLSSISHINWAWVAQPHQLSSVRYLVLIWWHRLSTNYYIWDLLSFFKQVHPFEQTLSLTQCEFILFVEGHRKRKWQPTPVFLPGESQGWRSLVGCHLWGRRVRNGWSDLAAAAAGHKWKCWL